MTASLIPDSETNEFIQSHLRHWLEHMGDKLSKETQELLQAQMKLNDYVFSDDEGPMWREQFFKFMAREQAWKNDVMTKTSIILEKEGKVDVTIANKQLLQDFNFKEYANKNFSLTDKAALQQYFEAMPQYAGVETRLNKYTLPKITTGSAIQGRLVQGTETLKGQTAKTLAVIATMMTNPFDAVDNGKSHQPLSKRGGNNIFIALWGGSVNLIIVAYDEEKKRFLMRTSLPGQFKAYKTDIIFHWT